MMAADISVQICTCNRTPRALDCLDALARQTYPADRFEVVLVDDGGDEPVAHRVDATRYRFHLTVIRVPHGGLAAARNAGISAATGEVVLLIDDDTMADERLVEAHWRAHQAHPRAVVLGWVNHVDPDRPSPRRTRRLADFSTSFFWTSNVSIRRDDLVAAGLFDEAFTEYGWEDVELGERLRECGLVRRRCPAAIVSHLKRPWRAEDVPGLLRQAAASGRTAVLFVRKRPTRRARLATGISPWRMAANGLLEPAEGWFERRVARAGSAPLTGLDRVAAYLWTRVVYFRAVRAALRDDARRSPQP
jgi:glycosyltransferase involved in cell wall biosynthesis